MAKKWIVEVISILFIILFVYTAVSKFIDYERFRAVIGQSPLITKFAGPLSLIVPVGEIVIALMLIIPRYRINGMYASFFAMLLFTAYIIVLVTLSEKIPCSCGGVIQRLTWDQHLVFNIFFIILAIVGIILQKQPRNDYPQNSRLSSVKPNPIKSFFT